MIYDGGEKLMDTELTAVLPVTVRILINHVTAKNTKTTCPQRQKNQSRCLVGPTEPAVVFAAV